VPVIEGSIFNFNQEAYVLLSDFEDRAKNELTVSDLSHADETGININGKRHWLHCVSNDRWTLSSSRNKRGTDAMNAMVGGYRILKERCAMIIGSLLFIRLHPHAVQCPPFKRVDESL
jgi:hypothetical protein